MRVWLGVILYVALFFSNYNMGTLYIQFVTLCRPHHIYAEVVGWPAAWLVRRPFSGFAVVVVSCVPGAAPARLFACVWERMDGYMHACIMYNLPPLTAAKV